jgi:asparagine synthase (glutamine-hydrolysing)
LRRAAADDEYFWNFEIAWSDTEIDDVITQTIQSQVSMNASAETVRRVAERLRGSEHGRRDYMNYVVYAMMQDHYFGNLMMGKMDLIASNFGIEVRSPYTEPQYAHFVFNVPAQFKARPDVVKYFFKKAIEGLLPNEIIYRPKQGFRAPVVELFEGRLADWSRPVLLESGLTAAGYLNADHLRHLLDVHRSRRKDYSTRLWTIMVLNLWYERWIVRL